MSPGLRALGPIVLTGCSQVLGVSDYAASAVDGGFFAAPACVECMHEKCDDWLSMCRADPVCSADLIEAQHLTVPPFVATAWNSRRNDEHWAEHHGAEASRLVSLVRWCIKGECAESCAWGRSFSCVGRFDYPPAPTEPIEVRVRIKGDGNAQPLAGVEASACSRPDCLNVLGRQSTDESGFAVLPVSLKLPTNVSPVEFLGILRFDAGPDHPPQVLKRTLPWFDGQYESFSLRTHAERKADARELGAAAAGQAGVDIQVRDCSGMASASAVELELWMPDPARTLRRCDTCKLAYRNDASIFDRALQRTSTRGSAYAFAPPGQLTVVARDAETKQVLAVLQALTLEPDLEYNVVLFPASRMQSSQVSPELSGLR